MDDCVVIALFRHGLTEENKRKAYLGWNDSPLCAEAQNLSTTNRYECYFSSDLQRCISTSSILFPNENLILLKEIREMDFGKWEGKTYEDLKGETQYQQWLTDPLHLCPPNGESFMQFSKRVQSGWYHITNEILAHDMERCAVISHGGVMKYLLSKYAPDDREFWSWEVQHSLGFELIFTKESLRRGDRCTLLQVVPLMEKEHG